MNKDLFLKLKSDKLEKKKKKKEEKDDLLQDDRFKSLFTDTNFEVI